jgi:glutaredoxin
MDEAVTQVVVYGKPKCKLCEDCKKKLDIMGVPYAFRNIEDAAQLHEGWRDDGTVDLVAMHSLINEHVPMVVVNGNKPFDYPGAMKFFKALKADGKLDPDAIDNSSVPVPPEQSAPDVVTLLSTLAEQAAIAHARTVVKGSCLDAVTFTPALSRSWYYEGNMTWGGYIRSLRYGVDLRVRYVGRRKDGGSGCVMLDALGHGKTAMDAMKDALSNLLAKTDASNLALKVGDEEPKKKEEVAK